MDVCVCVEGRRGEGNKMSKMPMMINNEKKKFKRQVTMNRKEQ